MLPLALVALVLFLAGHVAMVALSGFRVRMRGMITGRRAIYFGRLGESHTEPFPTAPTP